VPCQPSADSLPTGIQMIGAYGSDIALLQCAAAFEATAAQAWKWPRL
jgi:aspartyl-tRNA(Asn)/glutamyl-tRNA(Gln) amidotransferase subunit A